MIHCKLVDYDFATDYVADNPGIGQFGGSQLGRYHEGTRFELAGDSPLEQEDSPLGPGDNPLEQDNPGYPEMGTLEQCLDNPDLLDTQSFVEDNPVIPEGTLDHRQAEVLGIPWWETLALATGSQKTVGLCC